MPFLPPPPFLFLPFSLLYFIIFPRENRALSLGFLFFFFFPGVFHSLGRAAPVLPALDVHELWFVGIRDWDTELRRREDVVWDTELRRRFLRGIHRAAFRTEGLTPLSRSVFRQGETLAP